MASPREAWAALGGPSRALAVAIPVMVIAAIVVVFVGLGGPANLAVTPTPSPSPTDQALPPEPTPGSPEPGASPFATPLPPGADPVLGTDGRLTILLLGSDYRPAHPGNRTDAIMVVSVDPVSGAAAAFSIPRDAVEFPLPGGGRFNEKVNALYQHLLST